MCCVDSGYAFSGTEGQDRVVTDNLTNRFKDALYNTVFGKVLETPKMVNVSINLD